MISYKNTTKNNIVVPKKSEKNNKKNNKQKQETTSKYKKKRNVEPKEEIQWNSIETTIITWNSTIKKTVLDPQSSTELETTRTNKLY